jgi:hypothetical protein
MEMEYILMNWETYMKGNSTMAENLNDSIIFFVEKFIEKIIMIDI